MKNKAALFSGLALFASFCLLTGAGKLSIYLDGDLLIFGTLLAELIAFIIPMIFIKCTTRSNTAMQQRVPRQTRSPAVFFLSLFSGMTASILTFLINNTFSQSMSGTGMTVSNINFSNASNLGYKVAIIFILVIAAPICEEFFLRGALFSIQKRHINTSTAIVFSGLYFAMLHGSMNNFVGPMIAGLLYSYLAYISDSLWPAVMAHIVNNACYLIILWLTDTYGAFGIWKYFSSISLILLLVFGYLSLNFLERLLAEDRVRRFVKSVSSERGRAFVLNPGFLVFGLAFIAKAILHLF